MNKKLIIAVTALLCLPPATMNAQQEEVDSLAIDVQNEQAFTFTEAQLGEDDDVTQNVTVISSNRNVYASEDSSTAPLAQSTTTSTSTATPSTMQSEESSDTAS